MIEFILKMLFKDYMINDTVKISVYFNKCLIIQTINEFLGDIRLKDLTSLLARTKYLWTKNQPDFPCKPMLVCYHQR